MRLNVAIPEPHVTKPVLDAALEATTRLDEELLRKRQAPLWDDVRAHHIRWQPEPPGQEHFDHAALVMGRGHGDCDDLAPWHAASLRVTGQDRGARAVVRRSGPKRWHAIVQRSDGSIDDPSLEAGMPGPGRKVGVMGAAVPVMFADPRVAGVDGTYVARPHLAIRPVLNSGGQPEAWQARADLPWHWQPGESPGDVAMVSLHSSPLSDQAIVGALHGAELVGSASGFVDDEVLDRICCIRDMIEGADWQECAEEWGPEHATAASHVVGSLFGSLKKKLGKVSPKRVAKAALFPAHFATEQAARAYQDYAPSLIREAVPPAARPLVQQALPLAQQLAPMIPGWGPAAAMALQFASPMLQQALSQGQHMPPPGMAPMPMPMPAPAQPGPMQFGGGMPFGMPLSFG